MTIITPAPAGQPDVAALSSSESVENFARTNGLTNYLETSRTLVRESFVLAAPVEICKVEDPDSSDGWIEVCAPVRGEIAQVREAHRRYTRAWLAAVPADKALLVRLAIQIV
jgi:hypothetical protein